MANRILYEDGLGRISKIPEGRAGTFLAGGKAYGWQAADAVSITYTSKESGPLSNVSMALDQALLMTKRLQLTVAALEEESKRIDGQQNDVLSALRMEVADLNRFFQETSTKITRASHQRTTVSIASNPALTVDTDRQTVNLNLSAKGSYDDSRSALGVASVQLAIESLAAKNRELAYFVTALQETISNLQKAKTQGES